MNGSTPVLARSKLLCFSTKETTFKTLILEKSECQIGQESIAREDLAIR
jgi:hypothetical protein